MYDPKKVMRPLKKIYFPSKTSTASQKHVLPLRNIHNLSKTCLHYYITFN